MAAMHLSSLIDTKLVFLKSSLCDIREIYTFLVTQKFKKYPAKASVSELVDKLMQREADTTFLLPNGVSIPHLHLDDFGDTVISVLIPKQPIETEAGIVKIFFMVFTCKSDNSLYLHILKSIVKISQNEHYFDKVLNVKNAKEFQKFLKNEYFPIKKALYVCDVMVSDVITVCENTTLKELHLLFEEYNYGYFPVICKNNKVIGQVSLQDYIMAAFPAYTNFLNNLNFLKTFEPFEKFLKNEGNLNVGEIMKPVTISIHPQSSVVEAVFLITKNNLRELPVLENGNLVGIVSLMNIFRCCFNEE